jgi:integrase/recombinase XerD
MLRLHRRHLASCPHRSLTYRRCKCPVWVFGSKNGKRIRKSFDTASWETGEEILRGLDPDESPEKITLDKACERLIEDCKTRKLAKETIGKYELLARELNVFFKGVDIRKVGPDDLARFREGWNLSSISSRKKLERLRTVFRFAVERGWRRGNPAMSLKPPKTETVQKDPFSDAEMEKILWATEVYPNKGIYGVHSGKRIRAFILILRYSGLRIGDVVSLRKSHLVGNTLILRAGKTDGEVFVPVPKNVVEALADINLTGEYFFWSGSGLLKSAVADWQRSLSKVFKLAGVKGNAHKFRHTFAARLLESGVSTEMVAKLLAHRDIRITQRHYSKWTQGRQEIMAAEIEKAWKLT